MTLVRFLRIFKKAVGKHNKFDKDAKLLRNWIPHPEGGYSGADPICFVYWFRTGKVSADWLRIATKRLKLTKKVAWRLRYASDNRVPKKLDEHSKVQAWRIRQRIKSIVQDSRNEFKLRYPDVKATPYANVRTKMSARFERRLQRELKGST